MKKYELFNDLRDPWDWIKIDLYESWYTLWLDRFLTQILSNKDIENIENGKEKQFEVTINYLSKLLRKWKLKMKIYSYRKESEEESKENCLTYIKIDSKEWRQDNIEEWLKFVTKKWYSFDNEKDRKHFEDFWVMFTLPENEWMM